MIKYALLCDGGHDFEAWFADGASYDRQVRRGEVDCPLCRSTQVRKAVMAPAVARGGMASREPSPTADAGSEAAPALAVEIAERRARWRAFREHVIARTEDVGSAFPETARRIHDGDVPDRPIRGQASPAEARALIEDGVAILPLPEPPEDRH